MWLATDQLIAMAGAAALGAGLLYALHAHAADSARTPTLDMAQQVSLEKQELRIFVMPQCQAQLKLSQQTYCDSTPAKIPGGGKTNENLGETGGFASLHPPSGWPSPTSKSL